MAGTKSEAPSWYVFSADAYRIPEEPSQRPFLPLASSAPATAHPRTSTVRSRRTRDLLHSALLVLIILVVSGCYAVHLLATRPHSL